MDVRVWNFGNPVQAFGGLRVPDDLAAHVAPVPTWLVTTEGARRRGWVTRIEAALKSRVPELRVWDRTSSNPSFADLLDIESAARNFRPQQILAFGGGSVLDLAKCLAYLKAPNAPSAAALVAALREGRPPPAADALPWIAVPTTSGTGSEATPFATLWDTEFKKKYSLTANNLFARKALLDPHVTASLPWDVTLSTALDALSQCLESVWNRNGTPVSDALAADGVRRIFRALPAVRKNPSSIEARSDLQLASFFSGLCISRTRTAIGHSASYPLTAHFDTPHGVACSFMLPELWAFNLGADDGRLAAFARALSPDAADPTAALGERLRTLFRDVDVGTALKKTIPGLAPVLALEAEMFTPGRADNNLRALGPGDLRGLLERSLRPWGIQ